MDQTEARLAVLFAAYDDINATNDEILEIAFSVVQQCHDMAREELRQYRFDAAFDHLTKAEDVLDETNTDRKVISISMHRSDIAAVVRALRQRSLQLIRQFEDRRTGKKMAAAPPRAKAPSSAGTARLAARPPSRSSESAGRPPGRLGYMRGRVGNVLGTRVKREEDTKSYWTTGLRGGEHHDADRPQTHHGGYGGYQYHRGEEEEDIPGEGTESTAGDYVMGVQEQHLDDHDGAAQEESAQMRRIQNELAEARLKYLQRTERAEAGSSSATSSKAKFKSPSPDSHTESPARSRAEEISETLARAARAQREADKVAHHMQQRADRLTSSRADRLKQEEERQARHALEVKAEIEQQRKHAVERRKAAEEQLSQMKVKADQRERERKERHEARLAIYRRRIPPSGHRSSVSAATATAVSSTTESALQFSAAPSPGTPLGEVIQSSVPPPSSSAEEDTGTVPQPEAPEEVESAARVLRIEGSDDDEESEGEDADEQQDDDDRTAAEGEIKEQQEPQEEKKSGGDDRHRLEEEEEDEPAMAVLKSLMVKDNGKSTTATATTGIVAEEEGELQQQPVQSPGGAQEGEGDRIQRVLAEIEKLPRAAAAEDDKLDKSPSAGVRSSATPTTVTEESEALAAAAAATPLGSEHLPGFGSAGSHSLPTPHGVSLPVLPTDMMDREGGPLDHQGTNEGAPVTSAGEGQPSIGSPPFATSDHMEQLRCVLAAVRIQRIVRGYFARQVVKKKKADIDHLLTVVNPKVEAKQIVVRVMKLYTARRQLERLKTRIAYVNDQRAELERRLAPVREGSSAALGEQAKKNSMYMTPSGDNLASSGSMSPVMVLSPVQSTSFVGGSVSARFGRGPGSIVHRRGKLRQQKPAFVNPFRPATHKWKKMTEIQQNLAALRIQHFWYDYRALTFQREQEDAASYLMFITQKTRRLKLSHVADVSVRNKCETEDHAHPTRLQAGPRVMEGGTSPHRHRSPQQVRIQTGSRRESLDDDRADSPLIVDAEDQFGILADAVDSTSKAEGETFSAPIRHHHPKPLARPDLPFERLKHVRLSVLEREREELMAKLQQQAREEEEAAARELERKRLERQQAIERAMMLQRICRGFRQRLRLAALLLDSAPMLHISSRPVSQMSAGVHSFASVGAASAMDTESVPISVHLSLMELIGSRNPQLLPERRAEFHHRRVATACRVQAHLRALASCQLCQAANQNDAALRIQHVWLRAKKGHKEQSVVMGTSRVGQVKGFTPVI